MADIAGAVDSVASHYRLATPVPWINVPQRLRQYPPMAERVDETSLPFAVCVVLCALVHLRASATGHVENSVDIVDPEHHLVRRRGGAFTISVLAHDQFGTFAVESELRAMAGADADVFNEP